MVSEISFAIKEGESLILLGQSGSGKMCIRDRDTIKRVQDLMQERDMNLCVLAKKCGISYSTIQTTARRGGQLSVETVSSTHLDVYKRQYEALPSDVAQ